MHYCHKCVARNQKACDSQRSLIKCYFILDLYRDYQINKIKANRFINSNAEKRGMVSEVLIRNYE